MSEAGLNISLFCHVCRQSRLAESSSPAIRRHRMEQTFRAARNVRETSCFVTGRQVDGFEPATSALTSFWSHFMQDSMRTQCLCTADTRRYMYVYGQNYVQNSIISCSNLSYLDYSLFYVLYIKKVPSQLIIIFTQSTRISTDFVIDNLLIMWEADGRVKSMKGGENIKRKDVKI